MTRTPLKYILILLFPLCWSCNSLVHFDPMYQKTFIKLYGGEYINNAVDFLDLKDGGFVIVGYLKTTPAANEDILFIRTDSLGNVVIQKKLGDPSLNEEPIRILSINNEKEFIIAYNVVSGNTNTGFLLHINENGEVLNQSQPFTNYVFNDMTVSSDDNNLFVTGIYNGINICLLNLSVQDFSAVYVNNTTNGIGQIIELNSRDKSKYNNLGVDKNGYISMHVLDQQFNDFLDVNGNIGYYSSVPVGLNQEDPSDYYYILGYNSSDFPADSVGPFVTSVAKPASLTVPNQYVNVKSNYFLPAINTTYTDISNIIPCGLLKFRVVNNKGDVFNNFLLLGSESNGSSTDAIRLLELDADFKIVKNLYFGTGAVGDKAIKMKVLPDNSVVFLATVNYQVGQPYSKIALYKLNSDLNLDY